MVHSGVIMTLSRDVIGQADDVCCALHGNWKYNSVFWQVDGYDRPCLFVCQKRMLCWFDFILFMKKSFHTTLTWRSLCVCGTKSDERWGMRDWNTERGQRTIQRKGVHVMFLSFSLSPSLSHRPSLSFSPFLCRCLPHWTTSLHVRGMETGGYPSSPCSPQIKYILWQIFFENNNYVMLNNRKTTWHDVYQQECYLNFSVCQYIPIDNRKKGKDGFFYLWWYCIVYE